MATTMSRGLVESCSRRTLARGRSIAAAIQSASWSAGDDDRDGGRVIALRVAGGAEDLPVRPFFLADSAIASGARGGK